MIGNEDTARMVLGHARKATWTGSTRRAYLIDNVVYKVDRYEDNSCNKREYDRITLLRPTLRPGVFFPETHLFEVDDKYVIAMEYIVGQFVGECWCRLSDDTHDVTCMTEEEAKRVKGFCGDTGGDNVIRMENGDLYIIDAAT